MRTHAIPRVGCCVAVLLWVTECYKVYEMRSSCCGLALPFLQAGQFGVVSTAIIVCSQDEGLYLSTVKSFWLVLCSGCYSLSQVCFLLEVTHCASLTSDHGKDAVRVLKASSNVQPFFHSLVHFRQESCKAWICPQFPHLGQGGGGRPVREICTPVNIGN